MRQTVGFRSSWPILTTSTCLGNTWTTNTIPSRILLNPNPTKAAVVITHIPDQHGSPRGSGFSATHFEFVYYVIDSTGQDQIEFSPVKSACTVEQKVVRLVPTLQGGY